MTHIDVVCLVGWIAKKWKCLVLSSLICAVILVGWTYGQEKKNHKDEYERAIAQQLEVDKSSDEWAKELTPQEMADVYNKTYCWREVIYATEYLEKSILLHANPYAQPIRHLHCFVSDNQGNTNLLELAEYISDEVFYEKLVEQLDWDTEQKYLQELISISTLTDEVVITVTADTMERCDILSETVEKLIFDNFKKDISESYWNKQTVVNLELVEKYDTIYNSIIENQKRLDTYEINSTYSQWKMVCRLLADEGIYLYDYYENSMEDIVLEPTVISKRMVIYGVVAGFAVGIAVLAFLYWKSGVLHSSRELQAPFSSMVMSEIDLKKEPSSIEFAARKLAYFCKQKNVEELCICGSKLNVLPDLFWEKMQERLSAEGIRICEEKNVLKSGEIFSKISKTKNSVLVEVLDYSKGAELEETMKLFEQLEIACYGIFLVKI